MTVEIKPWDINEIDLLIKISKETFIDTFLHNNDSKAVYDYIEGAYTVEKLTQQHQNKDSFFYGIFVDGDVAGYLKLNVDSALSEPMGPDTFEIERIYIRTSFKRQGLGKKLYDFAMKQAKEHDKKRIWLGVWEFNFDAQKFYRAMGFERNGQHTFVMGEEVQTDFIMMKTID